MNDKERAVMQQALAALEGDWNLMKKARAALQEALDHSGEANEMVEFFSKEMKNKISVARAEQAEQEPVASIYISLYGDRDAFAASGKPIAEQTNNQLMEGYRIGLAEMREKCAKVVESGVLGHGECAAAIRAIKFEGDTGFRPVSEMIAEHKQDPKKAAAIEKAKMRKAEQKPVAWHHPECDGQCIACLIEKAVQDAYGTQGRDYMLRHINVAPVRTKDLTDDEIFQFQKEIQYADVDPITFARAVIAADREKNK